MIATLILVGLIVLYFYYEPELDILPDKTILLWYNYKGKRDYKVIYKIK